MINLDDFQYMWRGKATRPLLETEIERLSPIEKRGKGNGRALLLLHGFSSSPAVYRVLWPKLKHYDALACPVLPGHGENLAAFTRVTRDEWLTAAEAACKRLIAQYQTVEIIGLSLGGLLASHLAEKYPIQKLYLLAPAFKLKFNTKFAKIAARLLQTIGIKQIKSHAGNLFTHAHEELSYKQLPLSTLVELFSLIEETALTPPPCPVELFLGAHDDVVDSAYLAKQFEKYTHCNIHWLNQSAHAIPLDGDIKCIVNIINKA